MSSFQTFAAVAVTVDVAVTVAVAVIAVAAAVAVTERIVFGCLKCVRPQGCVAVCRRHLDIYI